ncbi:MAG TPA: AMP-binding protein, partial [Pyrinomonadaceae bacterium]|nr:AMP-binding protein [Pyrinomonadaceae bacterium]
MRKTIASYVEGFRERGAETWLAHTRGLRSNRWSYERVARTASQFARELEARSVAKGDRVLLWGENSPEWVAAFFGCILRGVIVVPLDAQSELGFALRVDEQVEAKLLLSDLDNQHCTQLNLPTIRFEELSSLVSKHASNPYPIAEIDEHDTVEIVFTSGTTAEPRGVRLTHRNLIANLEPLDLEIRKYLKWERLVHPLRFLNLLPLSHVFGQFMGLFVPQLLGAEVFFQESLNPSQIIETIRRERINVVSAVPRILDTLREKVEREMESCGRTASFQRELAAAANQHFLRRWWTFRRIHNRFGWKFWAFVSGGATLNTDTEQFWQHLGFAVLQGYGMTETASLISVNHPFKSSRGSIGKIMPGQEVRLDEKGEILVRGANISPGYWKGEQKASDEGWLRTGDLGEMDEAGNLFFKGREKEVIVTASGMNIYPEDIEVALNRQPEVRTSAVISFEGAHGPEPLAVLIMREKQADAGRVVKRVNETLSTHQQVNRWFVWTEEDFPRTATQKVRKGFLAEAIKARMKNASKAVAESSSPLAKIIMDVSGETPANLNPNANLSTDLKLDSLGRVELLSALEDRYQVEIDEASFTAATTLADVERMIREGSMGESMQYPFPRWAHRFPFTWIRFILFYTVVLPLIRLMCPLKIRGRKHLKLTHGPLLFISNHITMVDHALILAALPARFRHRLAIAMEGEILRGWIYPPEGTGLFTRIRYRIMYALVQLFFNVFPLPQKSGFRRSFAYAGEMMDRGYSVLVFPEGRRSDDGLMSPFKTGTGLLALKLGAPVVPIRIDGLFELKERNEHFAEYGQVSVQFG